MDAVGVVAIAVCTAGLFVVFAERKPSGRETVATGGSAVEPVDAPPEASTDPSETDAVACPRCGSRNDAHASVTFCWRCSGRLEE